MKSACSALWRMNWMGSCVNLMPVMPSMPNSAVWQGLWHFYQAWYQNSLYHLERHD